MSPPDRCTPPIVLLDVRDDSPPWLAHLATEDVDLVRTVPPQPDRLPSLVITDRAGPACWRQQWATELSAGHIAVLSVGEPQPADVCLPANCTAREICLAITLLDRIVQLRRWQHETLHDQNHWKHLAMHDALTDLPNRRAWMEALPAHLQKHSRVCVALVDVDFFKSVNEQVGHHVGDHVLREVAIAFRAHLRASDLAVRLGGDEFGLILPGVTLPDATEILDRLRRAVSHHLAAQSLPAPTLSAGYVCCPPHPAADTEAICAAAAESLRQAKLQNRDCTVAARTFEPDSRAEK